MKNHGGCKRGGKIRNLKNLRFNALKSIIMTIVLLFGFVIPTVDAAETTTVSIDPLSQIISSEESFTVNVSCVPGQPIRAFEFHLSFNASLLQVNSVTEGDIFEGYSTFFNSGTINNASGTVIDIYCLIIGSGNVTSPGTFVSVSCTSKNVSGTSAFVLSNVGVTNETSYVSTSVNNGSVQVDASSPVITDNSPSTGTTGDSYTFNVSVTDNVDAAEELTVKVDWSHGGESGNESMTNVGGNYFEKTVTLDTDTISDMTYTIYANDTYGNSYTTTQAAVTISDNDNPSLVVDNSDASGTTGDSYSFDITTSDNIDVGSVNISWLHGSLSDNLALEDDGDGTWSGSITLDNSLNDLVYCVQVNDTSSNYVRGSQQSKSVTDNDNPQITDASSTPSTQDIDGYVNITAIITDNIALSEIFLNITYPDDSIQNFSITANKTGSTYYCNKTYNTLGTYSYFIWVDDSSDNSIISSTNTFVIGEQILPQISNIVSTTSSPLDTDSSFGWVNITCDVTDNIAVDEVYLNITDPNSSFNNISMSSGVGDSYYYNSSTIFSPYGNYSYQIWANDTSDNRETSSSCILSMPPNWDLNNDGDCNIFDLVVVSNHYNETGTPGWIREDVDNNGQIKVIDLVFVSEHYDETWWI